MKDAIINFRTTSEMKERLRTCAASIEGYTITRILEEGAAMAMGALSKKKKEH